MNRFTVKATLALLVVESCLVALAQAPPPLSPSLASLVETERAFARMSVAKGRRDAFLTFFGEDALFFTPSPANAKQLIREWPAADSKYRLDWEPRFGDVAESADLGYTTGPYVRTSLAPGGNITGNGWYFTLWKKQADGSWKVAIDTGIQTPGERTAADIRRFPFEPPRPDSGKSHGSPGSLLGADRVLCASIAASGTSQALGTAGDDATIVYRDGTPPMRGRGLLARFFTTVAQAGRTACEPLEEGMSRAADLGYTYGKYSFDGSRKEAGYYLRVWRQRAGGWKLAADLAIAGQ